MKYSVKIKLMNNDSILPSYANKGDAGLDLFSVEEKVIQPGQTALIHTGIAIELPEGTEAQIRPRSGLALKHSVTLLNSPGTIDSGYRGEIKVIVINHGNKEFLIEKRMKIAQMVVKPILFVNLIEVDELEKSDRGNRGFGSSGIKYEG